MSKIFRALGRAKFQILAVGLVSLLTVLAGAVIPPRQPLGLGLQGAAYYILTLLLQLIPYSLAGGVGVKLGLSYYRADSADKDSRKVVGYPLEAVRDVARIYALVVPLFFIASLWESLTPGTEPAAVILN
jgi:hypothetical protein